MSTSEYTAKQIAYFWSRVNRTNDPDACWEWQAGRLKSGYGRVTINQEAWYTHRLAWVLTNGAIPEGIDVLHHCDNPPCCNPAHLFLGTDLDNVRDMMAKGRRADNRGEKSAHKLTLLEVTTIRQLYAIGGITQRELALEFGVAQQHISNLVRRKRWELQ